jgi:hypothetical protein
MEKARERLMLYLVNISQRHHETLKVKAYRPCWMEFREF